MYYSAIVEDEAHIREYLKNSLFEQFSGNNIPVSFEVFASGDTFLAAFEAHHHYDMVFLDIEMPGSDGMEVCRRIRDVAPDTLVVFISNKDSLVFQTFELQPFRFIRKSHYEASLPGLTGALIRALDQRKKQMVYFKEASSGDIYSFDTSLILYVEAQRKDCRIVTTTGEFTLRFRFSDIVKQLLPYAMFIQTSRSYLVNFRYVFRIGKNSLLLTNRTEIPVARGRVEEVKNEFLRFNTT